MFCERLLGRIREAEVDSGTAMLRFSASMGLAEIREEKAKTDVILIRADQALYKARESGRDRLAANDSICGQDGKTRLKPGLS